jgi:glycosyltransferase involved in cell wall biosynthesis
MPTRKVAFLFRTMPHYRAPFLNLLRSELAVQNVELSVLYGAPGKDEALKGDTVPLPWGLYVPSSRWSLGSRTLEWQDILRRLDRPDLVIMTQESRLIANYLLHLWRSTGGPRIAYWGHGRNLQPRAGSWVPETIKRILSPRVDWWFAYTELSAAIVRGHGFDPGRITVVNNAFDTGSLRRQWQSLDAGGLAAFRESLGLRSDDIAIFSGGMVREKRIGYLLEVCHEIRNRRPAFEVLFIGDGLEGPRVREAAEGVSWMHYLGARFGARRILPFAVSKVLLMPGMVGLVALDSFIFEVPLITVASSRHSPEIVYIENERNGIIVPDGAPPAQYAEAVSSLLNDPVHLQRLRQGCREAADIYTVEAMVERFARGVLQALES